MSFSYLVANNNDSGQTFYMLYVSFQNLPIILQQPVSTIYRLYWGNTCSLLNFVSACYLKRNVAKHYRITI